jgi:hypothetical protein
VTDEQRSRRPIFIATLWAGASWLFFHVARSTRMIQTWALRSRLEKRPTDLRQNTSYFGDRTLIEENRIGVDIASNGPQYREHADTPKRLYADPSCSYGDIGRFTSL